MCIVLGICRYQDHADIDLMLGNVPCFLKLSCHTHGILCSTKRTTVHSVQTSLQSDVCRCMTPQGRLLSLPIRWPLSQQVPLLQKRRPLSQTYQLRRGCQRLNLQRRLQAPSETQMGHRQLRAMFRISIWQRCAVLQSCPLYIKLSALSEQCATFHVIEV